MLLLRELLEQFLNNIFKHMTAISKSIYFDVLDDIVNKYNNTVQRTIKMKPIEVTGNFYIQSNKNAFNKDSMKFHSIKLHSNKQNSKFKVGDNVRISNIKTFLLKDIFQIGQKKFLLLIKLKIEFLGLMLLMI